MSKKSLIKDSNGFVTYFSLLFPNLSETTYIKSRASHRAFRSVTDGYEHMAATKMSSNS